MKKEDVTGALSAWKCGSGADCPRSMHVFEKLWRIVKMMESVRKYMKRIVSDIFAALIGCLGVHEHWCSSMEKLYSRNLGKDERNRRYTGG